MNNQQQTTNKAFGGIKPLIRRLHFYAGVFIGPFILVAALSGAAYAVAPTLENVVYGDIIKVQPSSQTVTLQSQIDSARAAYPDMEVSQVWPATKADDSTRVLLVDESLGEERLRSVFVNPGDGKVIGDEPSYSGLGEMPLRRFISEMHESMFLGTPGEMYSELAASWLWFVALGGLVLWWSRVGGRKIFTGLKNPTKKHQLDVALDGEETPESTHVAAKRQSLWNGQGKSRNWHVKLHGVAGTWLLVVMLGLSATGITWSAFAGANVSSTVDAIQGEPKNIETSLNGEEVASTGGHNHAQHGGMLMDHEGQPLTAEELSSQAQRVLDTARDQGLTGPLRLYPPEDNQHAWQASERWVPWRTTSDAVSVNGETGDVVDTLPFSELPLFSKLTSWGIYLHMGIMFGLPLQILLFGCALGIAGLVVFGYIAWWKRRPTRNGVAGLPGPNQPLSVVEWVIVGVLLATVGVFLPLFGISLAVMIVVDRVLARRAAKQASPRFTQKMTVPAGT